ncbi:hypothetical protein EDD18DRAFT_1189017 [Armillaria luteobubalina]|uniref:Uncharacterized protein n=1 Tax=Armillaria luteobubalina TaxID=153913 RepID=A0AA39UMX1_9AGAR|nr:hypothetical protein EDD18DRAFT_1189017 [Armillaria luteobubalina]
MLGRHLVYAVVSSEVFSQRHDTVISAVGISACNSACWTTQTWTPLFSCTGRGRRKSPVRDVAWIIEEVDDRCNWERRSMGHVSRAKWSLPVDGQYVANEMVMVMQMDINKKPRFVADPGKELLRISDALERGDRWEGVHLIEIDRETATLR